MDAEHVALTSPVAGVRPVAPHAHFVRFYEHDASLIDSVAEFIGGALAADAPALVLATPDHLRALEQRLTARDIDVRSARQSGRYVTRDAQDTVASLLRDGRPDATRFARVIEPLIAGAANGQSPVAIFGEMVALLWREGKHEQAVALEALWNGLSGKHEFALLCGYPIQLMASGPWHAVHDVCAAHSQALPAHGQALSSDERRLTEICDMQRRACSLPPEIGQRQAVERRLVSRERELSDFLEHAAEAIHSVGHDGIVRWANRFELDMLGYTVDEYIGHHIGEFYADPAIAAGILRRLRDGETLRDEPAQMRCKNGSLRDVLVTSNVRWDDGEFVQTRCFTRDVTEQLRTERALRASEERTEHTRALLASIVESSDDAIISKSLDGRITSWNQAAARIFGYTAEEAVGKPITMIIPAEHQREEQHILEKLARGERIEHFETVRVAKDGRRIDVSLTISPLRDRSGRVVGASKVARDVSDRKRMEATLRDADRRKDEFIAVLGHELRNPLAPIRSIAEVLRRTAAETPEMERLCTILERQVAQMTRLLDDLLDASRITRGTINFQREPLDLGVVVQRAVEASRPLLDARRHQLDVSPPQEPACVQGDAARLVQMLTNLLNNAAKYTPEGGRIELAVARRDAMFEVRVKDNGIGIAQATLPGIFDLFVQGERAADRAPEGLGIGLTLVRMIAERHGGSVAAHSAGTGRGSEFVVRLPVAFAAAGSATAPQARNGRDVTSKRILIVDDNRDSSESLAALLRLYGHDVFVAADGSSGMRMVHALRPDLALLDIGLPGMDGYEVARRLRASGCTLPLAALTGYGGPEDRERAQEAGFDHHFVKPIDPAVLERLVGSLG